MMRMVRVIAAGSVLALMVIASVGAAGEGDDAQLLAKLPSRRRNLVDGIRQAEQANGPAISAKFELEGSDLMLSVYTAKRGRQADAEHNVLMELNGAATAASWQPKTEVFEDVPHVARSAMQLTLLQLSRTSLAAAIARAEFLRPGTAYSAIPTVLEGRPVVEVKLATPDGKSTAVTIDLTK